MEELQAGKTQEQVVVRRAARRKIAEESKNPTPSLARVPQLFVVCSTPLEVAYVIPISRGLQEY
jgi:hypothetical protein